MPAPVPVANCLKITFLHGLGADAPAGSKIFFTYTGGPPTATDANNIASSCSTQWSSHLAALLSSSWELGGVTVQDLSSSSAAFGESTTTHAGTRAGTPLPVNCCTDIEYVILRRYRGGKPKGFWPFGVAGDQTTSQQWGSTYQSAVNTAYGAFISGIAGLSSGTTTLANHVSISYYSGFTTYTGSGGRPKVRATPRTTPIVDQVTTHLCRATVGSQRRRLTAP